MSHPFQTASDVRKDDLAKLSPEKLATLKRDETATAFTDANYALKLAQTAAGEAKAAYEAACVEYGRLHPTRFAKGAHVKRKVIRKGTYGIGYRGERTPDREVFERGYVTLCDGRMNYRNHYPKPGEWFVVSASGHTAYSLGEEWEPA